MRTKKVSLMFFVFLLLLTSCGALNVYVKSGTTFTRRTTITVIGEEHASGTKGQIEHLLLVKGFNIVSESTAKTAIKYKEKITLSDQNNSELSAEVYSIKELNSIYALEIHYSSYYDAFYWGYDTFSAKITDLNTGEVVLTANFSGKRSVNSVLNELADKIDLQVK